MTVWFFQRCFILELHKNIISYLILISFSCHYNDIKPMLKPLLEELVILKNIYKKNKSESNFNAINLVKSKINKITDMREDVKNEADIIVKMIIDNVGVNLKRYKYIVASEFINFIETQIIEIMGYNSTYKWKDTYDHLYYNEWLYVKNRLINSFAKNI